MKEKVSNLITRKKQLILYLLFGAFTTVCSLGACFLTLRFGTLIWHDENGDPTMFVDILGSTSQWIVGVLVAFLTNKKWVFTDAEKGTKATFKQLGIFSGARVATYFLEVFINLIFIALLEKIHCPDLKFFVFDTEFDFSPRFWSKLVSSTVIVVANYFISKLVVFKEKGNKNSQIN